MDVSTIHMTTFGQSTSQPHGTFDARLNHVNPKAEELKQRTFRFALDIIRFIRLLRETWEGRELADQLVRSGTRVGANYRAACRARSPRDFVNKIGIVVEESDKTVYWLQLIKKQEYPRVQAFSRCWSRRRNSLPSSTSLN